MKRSCAVLSLILLVLALIGDCQISSATEVVFQSGSTPLKGHLASPDGTGPFPAVIYLHGGMGPVVGGNPKATAEAIATAGFLGFAPIRRKDPSLVGNVQDVIAAIDYVKNLEDVDADQLAIIGFSRGGLLAFMASTQRRDLNAIVLMAPAHGQGALRRFLTNANEVTAPTLILVAKNDMKQADHVSISRQINTTLKDAGKETRLIVYPSYGRDGHRLFFEVRQTYWSDVETFLKYRLDAG